jgi:hypothetical protein
VLTAAVIIHDIVAIAVIEVFCTGAVTVLLIMLKRMGMYGALPYAVCGIVLWLRGCDNRARRNWRITRVGVDPSQPIIARIRKGHVSHRVRDEGSRKIELGFRGGNCLTVESSPVLGPSYRRHYASLKIRQQQATAFKNVQIAVSVERQRARTINAAAARGIAILARFAPSR